MIENLVKIQPAQTGEESAEIIYGNDIENAVRAGRSIRTVSKNLFDKTAITSGSYINSANGGTIANASWFHSDYIPVAVGQKYKGLGYFAYYDEDFNYLSGGLDQPSVTTGWVAPVDTKYLRISAPLVDINTVQVEAGVDANTSYEPFSMISGDMVRPETLDFNNLLLPRSRNMFDKAAAIKGFIMNADNLGVLVANAQYWTSDFIPVVGGETYAMTFGHFFTLFTDKNTPTSASVNQAAQPKYTMPSDIKYIRVSATLPALRGFQFEKGSVSTPYQDYYRLGATDIKGGISEASPAFTKSYNLFDKTDVTGGGYVNSGNGTIIPFASWSYSGYIPVVAGLKYKGLGYFAWYTKTGIFISGGLSQETTPAVTAPANAGYLVVSFPTSTLATAQVVQGEANLPYQPYGYVLAAERVIGLLPSGGEVVTVELIVRAGGTIGVDCDFTDIKSALDSITDATRYKRYFVKVKSGTYDISNLSYPYLGFRGWVDIVGQNKSACIIINRRASVDSNMACIDAAFYGDAIEYASVQNFTMISRNGKSPVHIDTDYGQFASGGSIYVIDCDLINETAEGVTHYQNGLACGLRDGQRVVAQGVNSNGQLWVHNSSPVRPNTGCFFELYNCRFPHTQIADIYCYGKDRFIMRNCKCISITFSLSDPFGQKRAYTDFSWIAEMEGNEIGYIQGTSDVNAGRYGLWTQAFNNKMGIQDSRIHYWMKNNSATTINRGDWVQLDSVRPDEASVKKLASGQPMYGQAQDTIAPDGYGTIQYRGIVFYTAIAPIATNDPVTLRADGVLIKATSSTAAPIGVSMDTIAADGDIRVVLDR